jgi:uncharacterized protein (TIGR00255 family)
MIDKGMRSMTGHGRGIAERGAARVTVELRSVNHRFLDLKVRGSASAAVEDAVAQRVREQLERGAVTATIRVERAGPGAAVRVDAALARDVHAQLNALADELGLPAPTLRDVVAQPGVISVGEAGDIDADATAAAAAAATSALDGLVAMRTTEGAALARDLAARADALGRIVDALAAATNGAAATARDRLHERVARLLDATGGTVDPARLAQEIAVLADRADVTEELVRARSHLAQLAAALTSAAPTPGAIGRRLDFLVQELGREINTLGAKSTAAQIAQLVVEGKTELERIREQVQNLE